MLKLFKRKHPHVRELPLYRMPSFHEGGVRATSQRHSLHHVVFALERGDHLRLALPPA